MIISKTPVRISLGGGGTDLPSYYEKKEGFLIAGAIDKYVYVSANEDFYGYYSLKYSKLERTRNRCDIKHDLIKQSLEYLGIRPGIEITSLADIPARTGMGSSGAFLISLLKSVHEYKGKAVSKRQLAEEACEIEIDIMNEHEGKQDKFACAFGGIRGYKFHKNGKVSIIPLVNEDMIKSDLEQNLYLFYTGNIRHTKASKALENQDEKIKKDDTEMMNYMDEIKEIGLASKDALEDGNFEYFGSLMHRHWCIKKKYSPKASNEKIDGLYDIALRKGAIGGKMIGAPGGGFLMFYHSGPSKRIWSFLSAMKELKLKHIPFKFDMGGVTTI